MWRVSGLVLDGIEYYLVFVAVFVVVSVFLAVAPFSGTPVRLSPISSGRSITLAFFQLLAIVGRTRGQSQGRHRLQPTKTEAFESLRSLATRHHGQERARRSTQWQSTGNWGA